MESGWTLGIKAVLVFICKLSTLSDASTTIHHHPPPHPPCLSCRIGQSPASPVGQLAAPRPLRLTFLQMTFFNLYNPGKADCAQVPPAVTSMRHVPPARRWSGVSCVSGADLFDFVCFFFFFSFWRSSSQNLCLSHAVFLTIILFSSPASILLYTRRSR